MQLTDVKLEPNSTYNYKYIYSHLRSITDTNKQFIKAAGLGFLPLLDNKHATKHDIYYALCAAANYDQLGAFKHLITTHEFFHEPTQMMANGATGTVLEWIVDKDLAKDIPTIDYAILLMLGPIPSSLLQRILERLRHMPGPELTVCGFSRTNEKIVLDTLFIQRIKQKDIQNMDLIVNLAAENKDYTVLQSGSYIHLAIEIELAKHAIEHPVYQTAFNHTLEDLRNPRLTNMVFCFFLMTMSLHFDGSVFMLMVSRTEPNSLTTIISTVVRAVTNEDWCRLMTTNLDFIRLCVAHGVTFIEKASDLIRLFGVRGNMKMLNTLFKICGVPCDKTQPWFGTLSKQTQRKLIKEYKLV